MSLEQALVPFLQMLKNEKFYSPHTCNNYQRDLTLFAQYLASQNIQRLSLPARMYSIRHGAHIVFIARSSICQLNRAIRSGASPLHWNVGMLEYWKNGSWPPARRAYGSERIMHYWITGRIQMNDK